MWNVFYVILGRRFINECGREEESMRRKGEGVVDMGNNKKHEVSPPRQRIAAKMDSVSCICKYPCLPRNSLYLKLICQEQKLVATTKLLMM